MCQPVGHDGLRHPKASVRTQEPYPAPQGPLNHQPPDGHKQVCQPGGHDGSRDPAAHLGHQAGDGQVRQLLHVPADGLHSGANQSGQVFGLGRQIYDPQVLPAGPGGAWGCKGCGRRPRPGEAPERTPYPQEEADY
ncbi:CNN2 [Vulpes lagopus]